mmetsp:Transcript_59100/g.118234  ORF Transcript_59100/g.118234 Transcript_59100/m.118234 type:complete len:265 (+) Transcript_59100:281-1075(+)
MALGLAPRGQLLVLLREKLARSGRASHAAVGHEGARDDGGRDEREARDEAHAGAARGVDGPHLLGLLARRRRFAHRHGVELLERAHDLLRLHGVGLLLPRNALLDGHGRARVLVLAEARLGLGRDALVDGLLEVREAHVLRGAARRSSRGGPHAVLAFPGPAGRGDVVLRPGLLPEVLGGVAAQLRRQARVAVRGQLEVGVALSGNVAEHGVAAQRLAELIRCHRGEHGQGDRGLCCSHCHGELRRCVLSTRELEALICEVRGP